MTIHLTALLICKPGKTEQIKPLLKTLVTASIREDACLQYELYQDGENENLFIFHETWKDAIGLEQHTQQPHHRQFEQEASELLDGPVVIYKTQRVEA